MQIQFNSDSHLVGSPERVAQARQILERELKHCDGDITRVEIHMSDLNSDKGGDKDKRCLLEARVAGLPPVAVEHRGGTVELAISGAARQLARALDNALAKARDISKQTATIRKADQTEEQD